MSRVAGPNRRGMPLEEDDVDPEASLMRTLPFGAVPGTARQR
jgi:hypothetical protein